MSVCSLIRPSMMIFGDSVLQGVMYSSESQKYTLYSDNRYASFSDKGIRVQNMARMGATVDRGLKRIQSVLTKEPSLEDTTVLLEFGGNDCDYDWKVISEDPCVVIEPHTSENHFVSYLHEAITGLKDRGAQVLVTTLIPIDAEKYFDWISRNLNKDNILHWLGDVSALSRWQEHYSRLAEDTARSLGCPTIDLRTAFLRSRSYKSLLCDDGIHPTEEGHRLIHETIAEAILH